MKEEEIKFDRDNTYNVKINYVLNSEEEKEPLKNWFNEWLFLTKTSQDYKKPLDFILEYGSVLHDCKLCDYHVDNMNVKYDDNNLTFKFVYN